MDKFLDSKIQIRLMQSYLGLFLISFIFFLFSFDSLLVNELTIQIFNFISTLDPSGILVFAGIAAGLSYSEPGLLFFRFMVFMFGLYFSFSHAVMGVLSPVNEVNLLVMMLTFVSLMAGVGMIFFTVFSLAVYGNDKRNENKYFNKSLNPNPSVKSDSAQPYPAPADLAHDLRYSRSRARRSRAQR